MSLDAVVWTVPGLQAALTLASEQHEEVNDAVSWGVGATALGILLLLLGALVAFGGGREHS